MKKTQFETLAQKDSIRKMIGKNRKKEIFEKISIFLKLSY